MIFISGVHGVGKTYFCNVVKEKLGIESYSASQLIAAQKKEEFTVDKRVSGIDENQLLLLEALKKLRNLKEDFILDGHFCLINEEGDISRISLETYVALNPDKIILLSEKPSVIAERRLQRDGVTVSEDMVDAFQQEEIKYAKEVAERLNIPLIISTGSSDIEKIINEI